ncbi:enhanced serine sensitivity protein SseB C-terminal domain-containing protein [Hymenobacter yonginensis]|uniref:Enhanced serine sensitivity protein SseB C-terminal domain-containing protein n=1 Tax=Hymenobacter yonginensis TaxID=748197 RepID=A0ABY7PU32_9BACT|nr:enhanced serine sensitivity protein SseB C-terminal domain-containing protein [Hymenobacter yonginensis]WBO86415.1 enhanced serine sensitivity protein SseB C-terminal domain-containing protein [Hymenobacter yonginensis]
MGLFDFLKKKPETPETFSAPSASPAAPAADSAAAAPAPAGPRYKGSNYTLPVEEAPAAPMMLMMPMMPDDEAGDEQMMEFPYQPTNILEELLMRAVHEPNLRPAFYQALLHEQLYAVTLPQEGQPGGEVQIEPGMEIQLQVLHDGNIPLFSSAERIFEGGVTPESVSYIHVRGLDLLQMVQATNCVLNPFSPAGKLLTSQEIQDLLVSDLVNLPAGPEGDQVPVQLGPPTTEPTELLAALREFCAGKEFLEQAYLAEMRIENSEVPPRLLLAFQADSPEQNPEFLQELGPVIEGRLEGYQFVDMMLLNPASDEPLNQYFIHQEPFYKRG